MAVEAPFHLQRRFLDHQRHAIDAAVAGFAADALAYVNAVIEVHEVRQVVDAHPVERLVVAEAGAHRLEVRAGVPDLRVAVDAGLGRRNAGRRRHFDRRVAIAALDADAAGVMLMRELDRLLDERDSRTSRNPIAGCVSTSQPRPSSTNTSAMMLAFDHALALFGNTCDMRIQTAPGVSCAAPLPRRLGRADAKAAHFISIFSRRDSCEKFLKLIVCCWMAARQVVTSPTLLVGVIDA